MASNERSVRRSHGQEAKRGWPGGQRIPWNGEAMGSLLLPCAPPGCPTARSGGRLGAAPPGQSWTHGVTLPPGLPLRDELGIPVVKKFGDPSLGRHVHRELLR